MTLPPERISIKRRRQDEPIEALVLESDFTRDKKRRFTDFYFQRLRHGERTDTSIGSNVSPMVATSTVTQGNIARNYGDLGIPVVRTSAPGDEVKDFTRYKSAQNEKQEIVSSANDGVARARHSPLLSNYNATKSEIQSRQSQRRFHLMRDLSAVIHDTATTALRRPDPKLRPPVATFIERLEHRATPVHLQPPIDRIVELNQDLDTDQSAKPLSEDLINRRTEISTFLKPANPPTKTGYSIRDDPATWNQESDQLANELAALAFEIDPADATEPPQIISPTENAAVDNTMSGELMNEPMIVDGDGDSDFIFETYVRVKHDLDLDLDNKYQINEVGVLVIDDENEDLWEKYIRSDDDDDDWDEEDEDSNAEDNPRNDYPDDEVSSDDEFGRNVYKHRRNASDDEEYSD